MVAVAPACLTNCRDVTSRKYRLLPYGMLLLYAHVIDPPYCVLICVISPLICWALDTNSKVWLNGYVFGFELLILNGALTFAGLCALRREQPSPTNRQP